MLLMKPLSRMQSLSELRGGSKVTKPILSNSANRYYAEKCYFLMLSVAVHGVTNNILNFV